MGRRGPRLKVIRRLGTPLPGLTRKSAERRPYPPGVHGSRAGRRKTEYGHRLEEKQKLRFHYGLTERQLRQYFERAMRQEGATGSATLALLERRLDNVVFRLGFAPTIPTARQLVVHGHIRVNGRRTDRPGYLVRLDDTISVTPRGRRIPDVVAAVERGPEVRLPGYLSRGHDDAYTGHVTGRPHRDDVPFVVDDKAIVEFYAR